MLLPKAEQLVMRPLGAMIVKFCICGLAGGIGATPSDCLAALAKFSEA